LGYNRYIQIDKSDFIGMDIKHYFIEKGQGEPLILLHGNGENCDYFTGQINVFAHYYHVYVLDTRGHGKTPRGVAPFTIRQFADDLMGFMDACGIEKAHILGFSDGGNIAMIFAMKYPERVNRLILNGANLDAKGIKRSVQCPIEIGYWFAKLFANKSEEAKLHAETLGLMVNDPNVKFEELSKIQAKTLVIAGTKDMVKEEHTRLIASHIPDAQLVILEGTHFVAKKRPDAFNRAVLSFLRDE
jgi:pimeloyl-ACP methyl ester carboxylesterase